MRPIIPRWFFMFLNFSCWTLLGALCLLRICYGGADHFANGSSLPPPILLGAFLTCAEPIQQNGPNMQHSSEQFRVINPRKAEQLWLERLWTKTWENRWKLTFFARPIASNAKQCQAMPSNLTLTQLTLDETVVLRLASAVDSEQGSGGTGGTCRTLSFQGWRQERSWWSDIFEEHPAELQFAVRLARFPFPWFALRCFVPRLRGVVHIVTTCYSH